MQKNELVSIIIPVFNAQGTLSRCLESVLNVDYKNIEVIVINDGSTDNSGELLEYFASTDSRVSVITCDNRGVSSARNEGIQHASGDWFCFVDSDDFISNDYFDVLLNSDVNSFDIVQIKNIEFYPKQPKLAFFKDSQLFPVLGVNAVKEKFAIYVWGKLYKKDIISGVFFSKKLMIGEDYFFNCQSFLDATIYYTSKGTYNYFLNPKSLTRGDFCGRNIWARFNSAEKIFDLFSRDNPNLAAYIYTTFGLVGTLRAYPNLKWILYLIREIDVAKISNLKFSAIWASNCNFKAKILSSLVLCSMMVRK